MKILLMLPYCSKNTYNTVFHDVSKRTNQQFQKYFRLFTEGLIANGTNVTVGCQFDVNRDIVKERIISIPDEKTGNIKFHYFKTYNVPFIGKIIKFIQSTNYTFQFCRKNEDTVVICDPNKVSTACGSMIGTKLAKGKIVHILSDLPAINTGSVGKRRSLRQKIANWIILEADGYYFFTEAMNNLINKQNKPYVVIECLVDEALADAKSDLYDKYPKHIMMYTGGIVAHYGLEQLVEAFKLAGVPDTELWIYGGGPFADGLTELCRDEKNIRYLGILPNDQIVREQMKATILVNPRFTNFEYTKYSFPSKNMEYMASGTPTLTTRLPGMPEEYNDHVFFIESETVDGMAEAIKTVYAYSDFELARFGKETREWAFQNKGYSAQIHKFCVQVLYKL